MSAATIYHGTPLTPRAALIDVLTGRAACVSFFRPDDVEAVEAVAPLVMFRQRRLQLLDAGHRRRSGVGTGPRLASVLRLAGATSLLARTLGGHSGLAGCAIAAERRSAERVALRSTGRSAVAHGWAYRSARPSLRTLRPGLSRLGWRSERSEDAGGGLRILSAADGRGRGFPRQPMAGAAHDARRAGRASLPLRQRRQHEPRAERTSL